MGKKNNSQAPVKKSSGADRPNGKAFKKRPLKWDPIKRKLIRDGGL